MESVLQRSPHLGSNVMHAFLTRFASLVRGVLSGLDRLFLCGTLRNLAHCRNGGEHVRGCWVVDLVLGKT
jgi:hypothetical protein